MNLVALFPHVRMGRLLAGLLLGFTIGAIAATW